jgi:hypothetical protein
MRLNGVDLPEAPLWALRALLGDARIDELGELAVALHLEHKFSTEELVCLAEHFRLFAETEAWKEEGRFGGTS